MFPVQFRSLRAPHIPNSCSVRAMISSCTPRVQSREEGAEPGHPDDQVGVLVRVLLRVSQCVGVQDAELDVPAAEVHEGLDQVRRRVSRPFLLFSWSGGSFMFMCDEVYFTASMLFAADAASAVGPLVSVPGMADMLPSVRATRLFLPLGSAPVTSPIIVVDALRVGSRALT